MTHSERVFLPTSACSFNLAGAGSAVRQNRGDVRQSEARGKSSEGISNLTLQRTHYGHRQDVEREAKTGENHNTSTPSIPEPFVPQHVRAVLNGVKPGFCGSCVEACTQWHATA